MLPCDDLTHIFANSLQSFLIDILPYSLHVVPVCDYAVLQWVIDLEQAPILLCLWPYEYISLQRSCHCPHMLWSPHVGREVAFRYVFACESRPDRAAAVVDDYRRIVES